MSACSIFDKDRGLGRYNKDNVFCGKIISGMKDGQTLKKEIAKVKNDLQANAGRIDKMFVLRDKHFAHPEKTVEQALQDVDLKKDDCGLVIKVGKEMLNKITRALNMGSFGGFRLSGRCRKDRRFSFSRYYESICSRF